MLNDETDVIFREEQRFGLWLRWAIALSMAVTVVLDVFALRQESLHQPPRTSQIISLIIVGVLLPIAIALLFWLLKLETEVRTDGLYVRFFPFHIRFKKFTTEDLSEHYARTYKPIREYGGWGIRCGWRGAGLQRKRQSGRSARLKGWQTPAHRLSKGRRARRCD